MSYKNDYLSEVILRVDFVSQEESLKMSLAGDAKNTCVKYYPIPEDRLVETQQVVVTNEPGSQNTVIKKEQFHEWHFWGMNREKELCITNACMFISMKRYSSYAELKREFFDILEELISNYPKITINRVGLRYVNQIEMPQEKKSRKSWNNYWSKYITEPLIKGLCFPDNDAAIARQMNSTEMNYGDHMLRFQYGIHNADYPAPNKKNVFIIDTDVYTTGLIDLEDVKSFSDRFHQQAIEWFEKAIKEELRRKMEADYAE